MSDDFDDDLYNVYNGGGQEDTYNDEDLYGEDPVVDVNVERTQTEKEQTTTEHDQHDASDETQNNQQEDEQPHQQQNQQQQQRYQQQNMMNNNNMNWGFQGNPYQQYMAAYQRNLQQQMAMNPYQMQQMFQRQMRQQMPQQQQQQQQQQQNHKAQPYVKKESNDDNAENKSDRVNSDEGKMFIGGLNWETTDESLRQYFSQFGEVLDCTIMRDPTTQRSRGFAFLTMKENADIDKIVSQADHQLDGKRIDPKRAIPRDEQDKTEKIFVGGISAEVNEEEFREFFTQFGTVIDATLMLDRDTGRPRGFGFVTFENSNGVEEALKNSNLSIKDKTIEVKKAMPKNRQQQNRMGAAPVLNPNFRPQQGGGYMPNNRYAGAANFGNMMGRNNFNNMYGGNMYGGAYNNMAAAAAAAAAAYYNDGGSSNNNNYQRGGSSSGGGGSGGYRQQQQHQQDDTRSGNHDHRRGSRDRSSHNHNQSGGSGGGAVHASQSRNQQHYRPY